MVHRSGLPLQALHRRGRPAFELVVIIAVEQIMLAIVLVLHNRLDLTQPRFETAAVARALAAFAIGVASPFQIGLAKVCLAVPNALINQCLQSRAVGTGF